MSGRSDIASFEDLDVFQRAYRISLDVHRASLQFPKIEQHALADQIRRASKSICGNIAEGFGKQRRSGAEFKRYLLMAIGSADEMQSGRLSPATSAISTLHKRTRSERNTPRSQPCSSACPAPGTKAAPADAGPILRPEPCILIPDRVPFV